MVRFGGVEHTGWLPAGAAKPVPTPVEDLRIDIEIQSDAPGFLLCWQSQDGTKGGDTWHQTLADAEATARENFGIESSHWAIEGA